MSNTALVGGKQILAILTILATAPLALGTGCSEEAPAPVAASDSGGGGDVGTVVGAAGTDPTILITSPVNNSEFVYTAPGNTVTLSVTAQNVTVAPGQHYFQVYVDGEFQFLTTSIGQVSVSNLQPGYRQIAVRLFGPGGTALDNESALHGIHVKIAGPCATNADCSDGNTCSTDACKLGSNLCGYGPVGNCCDQDLECPNGWFCEGNQCNECADVTDCDDGNVCTADFCDAGICLHVPLAGCCLVDTDCNDGLFCTTDVCEGTTCVNEPVEDPTCCDFASDCAVEDPCIYTTCYKSLSQKKQFCRTGPALPGCCDEATDCDDGNSCTLDSCFVDAGTGGGICAFVADPEQPDCCVTKGDCNDGDPATVDKCIGGLCQNIHDESFCALPSAPSTLVINEIMAQPGGVLKDESAEWIEVYNPTDKYVSVHGWTLEVGDGAHEIVAPTLQVAPQGYVTFGRTKDPLLMGFTSHYAYGESLDLLDPLDKLSPGADVEVTIALYDGEGDLVDEVTYDSTTWPMVDSRSMELRNPYLDNEDPGSWRASGFSPTLSKNKTYGLKSNQTFGSPRAYNGSSFLGLEDAECALPEGSTVCTEGRCNLGGKCVFSDAENCCLVDSDCQDGNLCTEQQCDVTVNQCTAPVEVAGCCLQNTDCDDGNACNLDRCIGKKCRHSANIVAGCCFLNSDCDDKNPCTLNECNVETALCKLPVPLGPTCCTSDAGCDDGDPATLNTCDVDANLCVYPADPDFCSSLADPCDDGNPCTEDQCNVPFQECVHTAVSECCVDASECPADADLCTAAACDPATNTCTQAPIPGCCLQHEDCEDGNACTNDFCNGLHVCHYTDASACCLSDSDCNDGNLCTVDACVGNTCQNSQVADCCEPSASQGELITQCGALPDACDKWECTLAYECVLNEGGGCCETHSECDDGNTCTLNVCQADNTCKTLPFTTAGCCSTNFNCDADEYCHLPTSSCKAKEDLGGICLGDPDCLHETCLLSECVCPDGTTGSTCEEPTCTPECADDWTCTFQGCIPDFPQYNDHVQPILEAKCSGCHDDIPAGSCEGGTCFVHFFEDFDKPSQTCVGLSVKECALDRIQNGSEPFGAGCTGDPALDAGNPACLTANEQAILEHWLDEGGDCGPDGTPCDWGDICQVDTACSAGACVGVTPCDNNAVCGIDGDWYKCECVPGYAGQDCEFDVDECGTVSLYGFETIPVHNNAPHDVVVVREPVLYDGCVDNFTFRLGTSPAGGGFGWKALVFDYVGTSLILRGESSIPAFNGGLFAEQTVALEGCLEVKQGQYVGVTNTTGGSSDLELTYSFDGGEGYLFLNGALPNTVDGPAHPYFLAKGDLGLRVEVAHAYPCDHDATCNNLLDNYTCDCPAGYEGYDCEIDTDDCSPDPCESGSTCVDLVDDFACECLPGFSDKTCSTDDDECEVPNVLGPDPAEGEELPTSNASSSWVVVPQQAQPEDGCIDRVEIALGDTPLGNGQAWELRVYEVKGNAATLVSQTVLPQLDAGTPDVQVVELGECVEILAGQYAGLLNPVGPTRLTYTASGGSGYWYLTSLPSAALGSKTTLNSWPGTPGFRAVAKTPACDNDAACTDLVDDYSCACQDGFEGGDCEVNIDECELGNCQNGSECEDLVFDYFCHCLPGWTGKDCDVDIDNCDFEPCENGSVCEDLEDDYFCHCGDGYEGKNCQIDVDDCALDADFGAPTMPELGISDAHFAIFQDPVDIDGCIDEVTLHLGSGPVGAGVHWEIRVYEVADDEDPTTGDDATLVSKLEFQIDPTDLDAQTVTLPACHPVVKGQYVALGNADGASELTFSAGDGDNDAVGYWFMASQPSATVGSTETWMLDPGEIGFSAHVAYEVRCDNNAQCVDLVDFYECECAPGFSGYDCEVNDDECGPAPCQNGSTCNDLIDNYTCTCPDGFSGYDCEVNVDECASEPCENGSTCVDLVYDYYCACADGYSGKDCEVDDDGCAPVEELGSHLTPPNDTDFANGTAVIPGAAAAADGLVESARVRFYVAPPNHTQVTGTASAFYVGVFDDAEGTLTLNAWESVDLDPADDQEQIVGLAGLAVAAGQYVGLLSTDGDFLLTHADAAGSEWYYASIDDLAGFGVSSSLGGEPIQGAAGFRADITRPDPCLNGSVCSDLVFDYFCACPDGYEGKDCETNISECDPNPCLNGACTDLVNDYYCTCDAGYIDRDCEVDANDCAQKSELGPAGALPTTGASTYDLVMADLPSQLDGEVCSVKLRIGNVPPGGGSGWKVQSWKRFSDTFVLKAEAGFAINGNQTFNEQTVTLSPCLPVGQGEYVAVVGLGDTKLTHHDDAEFNYWALESKPSTSIDGDAVQMPLVQGAAGFRATVTHDYPCENLSSCVDAVDDYVCECPPGYSGKDCEQNDDECDPDPCQNDSTCIDNIFDYTCICLPGFDGKDCQINLNECAVEPCQNGTCQDLVYDYQCICPPGWEGKDCGVQIDECDSSVVGPDTLATEGASGAQLIVIPDPALHDGCIEYIVAQFNGVPAGGTGDLELRVYELDGTDAYMVRSAEISADVGLADVNLHPGVGYLQKVMVEPCLEIGRDEYVGLFNPAGALNTALTASGGSTGYLYSDIDPGDPATLDIWSGDTSFEAHIGHEVVVCEHGSACEDLQDDYDCECLPGFSGKDCQVDDDECDLGDVARADCCLGHGGQGCEEPACEDIVCKADASCCDNSWDELCAAKAVALCGETCGSVPDCCSEHGSGGCEDADCEADICDLEPSCCDTAWDEVCAGYAIAFCGVCQPPGTKETPCDHSAGCEDLVNDYFCHCLDGFAGKDCEIDIDECATDKLLGPEALPTTGLVGHDIVVHSEPLLLDGCIDTVTLRFGSVPGGIGDTLELRVYEFDEDLGMLVSKTPVPGSNGTVTTVQELPLGTCVPIEAGQYAALFNTEGSLKLRGSDTGGGGGYWYLDSAPGGAITDLDTFEHAATGLAAFSAHVVHEEQCANDAICNDHFNEYSCTCLPGFSGELCATNDDECDPHPCNHGACIDLVDDFECDCDPGWGGELCDVDLDECDPDQCQNGSECVDLVNLFTCVCPPGYDGNICQVNINECGEHVVGPASAAAGLGDADTSDLIILGEAAPETGCVDQLVLFFGELPEGGGDDFEVRVYDVDPNAGTADMVSAQAIALDMSSVGFKVTADVLPCLDILKGQYVGLYNANGNIHTAFDVEADGQDYWYVEGQPGDTPTSGSIAVEVWQGNPGFEAHIDHDNPCLNGAICTSGVDAYTCTCPDGYTGFNCEIDIDECAQPTNPCHNAAGTVTGDCTDLVFDYSCSCHDGWTGDDCEINIDECDPSPCENGECIDGVFSYACICEAGWSGTDCEVNDNECDPDPCQNGAPCTDLVDDFSCACLAGFSGKTCNNNDDECDPDPCQNGATCEDLVDDFFCHCLDGFSGKKCSTNDDECATSPCENGSTCVDGVFDYSCECQPGWSGKDCEINDSECDPDPCVDGTCVDLVNDYHCVCDPGYIGRDCEQDANECAYEDSYGAGLTATGASGHHVTVIEDAAQDEGCIETITLRLGNVPPGGASGWEVRVYEAYGLGDLTLMAKAPLPINPNTLNQQTLNLSPCMPIGQGQHVGVANTNGMLQLTTNPAGSVSYWWRDMATTSSLGTAATFMKGAGGPGFSAELSYPTFCENGSVCVNEVDDFSCDCAIGFTGDLCEIDVDDCANTPCANGATCTDLVNAFECDCLPGYAGTTCQIDIDECDPNQCENSALCVDLVNAFECICPDGYDGTLCEINIDECDPNPCQNGAACTDAVFAYTCTCLDGFDGVNCEVDIDECAAAPCDNGGVCTDGVFSYTCDCPPGFTGNDCEIDIDFCIGSSGLGPNVLPVGGSHTADLIVHQSAVAIPGLIESVTLKMGSPPPGFGSGWEVRVYEMSGTTATLKGVQAINVNGTIFSEQTVALPVALPINAGQFAGLYNPFGNLDLAFDAAGSVDYWSLDGTPNGVIDGPTDLLADHAGTVSFRINIDHPDPCAVGSHCVDGLTEHTCEQNACECTGGLVITGIVDGDLTGGAPKGVELYVCGDVADLSEWGLGSANNGGGSDGEEFTFPADSATAGSHIYVGSNESGWSEYFGFLPDYTTGILDVNGDDAVELFGMGAVVDVYGQIDVDGTGMPWEYTDSFSYRILSTGPNDGVWDEQNWVFGGVKALDGLLAEEAAPIVQSVFGSYDCPEGSGGPPTAAVDWCRLHFPESITVEEGAEITVFGHVFHDGITDVSGTTDPSGDLMAEFGYGPDGSDPVGAGAFWSFTTAAPNLLWDDSSEPGNDEYMVTTAAPGGGVYDYAFRFSVDAGASWTYCDLPTGTSGEDGSEDGYQIDNAGDMAIWIAGGPAPGDLVISEVMPNPDAVGDSDGEWFALYNASGGAVDLTGCTVTSNNDAAVAIAGITAFASGAELVFAKNGDVGLNGGVAADFVFGDDITLANTTDSITVSCGAVIDTVTWDETFLGGVGASLTLDKAQLDAAANDDGLNWCLAITPYGGGDFGTPGAANDDCPGVNAIDWCRLQWPPTIDEAQATEVTVYGHVHEAGITTLTGGTDDHPWIRASLGFGPDGTHPVDNADVWSFFPAAPNVDWTDGGEPGNDEWQGVIVVPEAGAYDYAYRFSADQGRTWLYCDLNQGGGDGSANGYQVENAGAMTASAPACGAGCPGEGELVITEILKDPSKVTDGNGEWFEIYNTTEAALDLQGCTLRDDGTDSHVITSSVPIAGTSYVVLGTNADEGTNGGVTVGYEYSGISLANGDDEVVIVCGGVIVDWVGYTDAAFPDLVGTAMQLDASSFDMGANDNGANWCPATAPFGAGDLGTPGAANAPCVQ